MLIFLQKYVDIRAKMCWYSLKVYVFFKYDDVYPEAWHSKFNNSGKVYLDVIIMSPGIQYTIFPTDASN